MKYKGLWITIATIILVGFFTTNLTRFYTEKQMVNYENMATVGQAARRGMLSTQESVWEESNTDLSVLERLEELDVEIANKANSSPNTVSPNSLKAEAESARKLWEGELDRMVTALAELLDTEEKDALLQEQIEWTRRKEASAIEISSKSSSAAGKELQYNRTLTEITRDRAYELERRYRELLSGNLDN